MKYFCSDTFHQLPLDEWERLVDKMLARANYLELNQFLLKGPLPPFLAQASVIVPEKGMRVYGATHRFLLTPEVINYVREADYEDWSSNDFEDPALFQDDTLLLGTISHENYVIALLDDIERQEMNKQGFNFWCEWS